MKARYFFILAIILAVTGAVLLRYDRMQAFDMRQEILQKDEAAEPVAKDIKALEEYVATHMNSSIRLELVYSYNRAVEAAQRKASQNAAGNLYAEAQAECDRQGVLTTQNAQCVQEYLSARLGQGNDPTEVKLPDMDKFIHTFTSPLWVWNATGVSLLATAVLAVMGICAYVLGLVRKK